MMVGSSNVEKKLISTLVRGVIDKVVCTNNELFSYMDGVKYKPHNNTVGDDSYVFYDCF